MATTNISQSREVMYRTMVELGGGVFRAYVNAEIPGVEAVILFQTKSKTLMGIPVSEVSAEAVRKMIQRWEESERSSVAGYS